MTTPNWKNRPALGWDAKTELEVAHKELAPRVSSPQHSTYEAGYFAGHRHGLDDVLTRLRVLAVEFRRNKTAKLIYSELIDEIRALRK